MPKKDESYPPSPQWMTSLIVEVHVALGRPFSSLSVGQRNLLSV
jgi:hypothetical protein